MTASRLVTALCVAAISLGTLTSATTTVLAASQTNPTSAVMNSDMTGETFFDVLVAELRVRRGEIGAAFRQVLKAAQRTKDENLFRRAVSLAVVAQALPEAIEASKSWQSANPQSIEAKEVLARLYWANKQPDDAAQQVQKWLKDVPKNELADVIASLPRLFSPGNDPVEAQKQIIKITEAYIAPTLSEKVQASAWATRGQAALMNKDKSAALESAQKAIKTAPQEVYGAILASELLPNPEAESLVLQHLAQAPESVVRWTYVRKLSETQRSSEAIDQLQILSQQQPMLPSVWLALGLLQTEMKHDKEGEQSLKRFLEFSNASTDSTDDDRDETEDAVLPSSNANGQQSLDQAYLALAQIAERQKKYKQADQWLQQVQRPEQAVNAAFRRAVIKAKSGKVTEAVNMIRQWPTSERIDEKRKIAAEIQLYREVKQWRNAYDLYDRLIALDVKDVDVIYEKALLADRLGLYDDMEKLFRQIIALKPDYYHAYNALGYSLVERNIRLEEARELIAQALALAPGDPFILDSLGWAEYRLGHLDESIRLLKQAWQSRADTEIGAHLGEVLWANQQHDEARKVWRQASERDADNDLLKETLKRFKVKP